MADYLVYWRGFWKDGGNLAQIEHDWNTNNESFYNQVKNSDIIWVVVSSGKDNLGEWRLLERIHVRGPDSQHGKTNYGRYHIIGDHKLSQVFEIDGQSDFAPILQKLHFATGKQIAFRGAKIGQALQTVRRLGPEDTDLLQNHSKTLTQI